LSSKAYYKHAPFLVLVLLLATTLISLGWLYSRNALFRFSEIEVVASDPKTESFVRSSLLAHMGQSLFAVPFAQIESELLASPDIKKIHLRRQWPSGVSAHVEMREPIALIWHNKGLWLVDVEGFVFRKMTEARDLPVLRGVGLKKIASGGLKIDEKYSEALQFLFNLLVSGSELRIGFYGLDELIWEDERGLVLRFFDDEVSVELGRQNFDEAWGRALKALYFARGRGQKLTHLDASFKSRVVGITQNGLHTPNNRLNLEELVQRKDSMPPSSAR